MRTLDKPRQAPIDTGGIRVFASSRLRLDIAVGDFEGELALAEVRLCDQDGRVSPEVILLARRDGVAHDITIETYVDGASAGKSVPVTFECRAP